jgi:hypothetical protein
VAGMDRRNFLATGLASLACCSCAGRVFAGTGAAGCSLTAAELADVRQTMKPSSGLGLAGLDDEVLSQIVGLRERYGLRPGATFIDDAPAINAYAVPDVLVPKGDWGGEDGTVLIGTNLLFKLFRDATADIFRRGQYSDQRVLNENGLDRLVIIAHEFGHILQFKNGLASGSAWQMEPHADFLAGWAIDKSQVNALFDDRDKSFENAVRLMFSLGDTAFNSPKHHGEPQFRAAMVKAGQDAHALSAQEAFEKGAKLVGLKI